MNPDRSGAIVGWMPRRFRDTISAGGCRSVADGVRSRKTVGEERMDMRVAWVTGASAGIGKAVAAALAEAGFHVYASARRAARLQESAAANITPLPLDVTDSDAVARAASQIDRERGRIDVLVNNAGYGLYGTIEG
ncbi:MAG: SDR family NAD(P)-dependent oxidoreductase, partial [Planctomycetota bacterium]